MGVAFNLRMVDHRRVVDEGLIAVNRAVESDDPKILVEYILGLGFVPNPETVAWHESILAGLHACSAPEVLVLYQERLLRYVNGEAYTRHELRTCTLKELQELIGSWRWLEDSFSLRWFELDWFLQPADGPDEFFLMYPLRPKIGTGDQTVFDQALCGSMPSPRSLNGLPVIHPCGSNSEDCFGYNSPPLVQEIWAAIQAVNPSSWASLVPDRVALHKRAHPDKSRSSICETVDREFTMARDSFAVLRAAYKTAAAGGLGVACEYSL